MHMIRKGQIRWLAKNDVLGQVTFIRRICKAGKPNSAALLHVSQKARLVRISFVETQMTQDTL
jgi:hypothetical protein